MVGIISVVIGGHFGGGDHFDGADHFGGGTRDFKLINCPILTKNLPWKLVKTSTQKGSLQAMVEIG